MAPHTAYAELGLVPGASEPEAKAAWRRMVSQWHPDRNASAGAVARMQRINLAFEALRRAGFPAGRPGPSAPPARAPAARSSPATKTGRRPGTDPGAQAQGSAQGSAQGDTHGNAQGDTAAPASPPRTLRRKVRISLEEATLGCTKVLRGAEQAACAPCGGSGEAPQTLACAGCAGLGRVRQAGWFSLFGGLSGSLADCADCGGSGRLRPACAQCAGSGRRKSARYRVSVRLPPGVRDGDELQVDASRWAGRATAGGGLAADLLIRVAVQPHPFFNLRDDGGLHCTLPVSGFAWMAGRPVQVPTPDGWHHLPLDRACTDYRIAGAGFPVGRRGPRGDLCVHVVPRFPSVLSTDQHILLDQLVATQTGAGAGAEADPALRAWQQTLGKHPPSPNP